MKHIYLDNSATTRISEEALNKYVEISRDCYGNPSSLHSFGYDAEKIIEKTRLEICTSLAAKGAEVIFTSSGSEANNLAILGRAYSKERYKRGAKIITTDSEHASVREPIKKLENERDNLVFELEQRMARLAKMLKKRSLSRRKYKLGTSPNDHKG